MGGDVNLELTQFTISSSHLEQWQNILDDIAAIAAVPAALIMRADPPFLEVVKANRSDRFPFKAGDREKMAGFYCEAVVKSRQELLVPNALKDPLWDHNPDLELGLISYLGLPLNWPDGSVFGTICILDSKENPFNDTVRNLLMHFKGLLEMHLNHIAEQDIASNRINHIDERYRAVFESAPVSLWEMDYSEATRLVDELIDDQDDLDSYFNENPRRIIQLVRSMKVLDVNARTLPMFGASSKEQMLASTGHTFTAEAINAFAESVKAYGRGEKSYETETVARTLDGRKIPVLLSITFPLFDSVTESVVVCFSDISKRKEMEMNLLTITEQSRALSRKLMKLQEDERRLIACELHDTLGQSLTCVGTLAKLISRQPDSCDNGKHAEKIDEVLNGIFNDIRNMLVRIRPAFFDPIGLPASIQELINSWQRSSGIRCHFKSVGQLNELDDAVNIAIYRVVQECLTNISRHADASQVEVFLSSAGNGMLMLQVADNGRGVDLSLPNSVGLGITGMRERILGVNGTCEVDSSPGNGMSVSVLIPLSDQPATS